MRVKRYVVDSMPDALQLIRSELGKDAVILNTKEVRTGGFLGLFGKRKIEVIAATDTAASKQRSGEWIGSHERKQGRITAPIESVASRSADDVRASTLPNLTEPSAAKVLSSVPQQPTPSPVPGPSIRQTAPQMQKNVEKYEDLPKVEAGNTYLLEEIKQMKEMVQRLTRQTIPPGNPLFQAFDPIRELLLAHEVMPDLVEQWIEKAALAFGDAAADLDHSAAREAIKHALRETMLKDRVQGIRADSRVIHFVGPTGVGKTTTIAKLAAEQVLKHKKKVGFITSDTYRIAAVEQLKTYAMILNVPLEVVFSPQELNRAFEQLSDCELIFMDTAGRNYRNEMYVSELNSLLHTSGRSETYLVLSMTTRYKDMKAIVDNFSRFKLDKVLFTKKDETECFGAPFNLLHEYDLMLSYVSDGQNVPDDIALIDTEEWIDTLLEELSHE